MIDLLLAVPPNPIENSINSDGPSVAGYNFTLTCTVMSIEGLGTPNVLWVDAEGYPANSTDDILLGDLMTSGQITTRNLYFDPIRISDEGIYTCISTLYSPSLDSHLNSSASYELNVQLSKTCVRKVTV